MRNLVAKNDFNRASVHQDKKKAWEPDEEEGLNEYYGIPFDDGLPSPADETDIEFRDRIRALSIAEYNRGVNASGIV